MKNEEEEKKELLCQKGMNHYDGSDLNDRDKIVKGGSVCYKNFI